MSYITASAQVIIPKVFPFPIQDVTLKPSWIKDRENLNIKFLESLDADRLLHNFRINANIHSYVEPLEGWEAPDIGLRGHFVGHYLSAVSLLVKKSKNMTLSDRLDYLVNELYKCQQIHGNGYLSAFPEKDFDTLEKKFGGVWAPYYTYHKIMQGLLDVYIYTNNQKAYDMVIGMADYVSKRMKKLDDNQIENILYTVGANPGNEPGAMNDVLYKLYRISKNHEHLQLAQLFDRKWFLVPLSERKDILSGLHANTHIALVTGFAQHYEITGDQVYGKAVTNFWEMLQQDHAYVNGSSSGPRPIATTRTSLTSEHWGIPGCLCNTFSKEIAESCVSHNTQKLNALLFTWTLNPKYSNTYMNMFYNAIMPIQSTSEGKFVYHLPLASPRTKKYLKENDFYCCNGSSTEAFAQLNSNIYFHNDTTLWVNLYIPSILEWKERNITIESDTSFPKDNEVSLTISTKRNTKLELNLLIPSWSKNCDIYINGELHTTTPNSLYYVPINREWKDKDQIRLVFHPDFHIKSMPDNNDMIAIYYGAMLLAFETKGEIYLKGDPKKILKHLFVKDKKEGIFLLKNNNTDYILRPLFDIDKQSYGVYATITNY